MENIVRITTTFLKSLYNFYHKVNVPKKPNVTLTLQSQGLVVVLEGDGLHSEQ